jgi:4-hydroxybenzoate polyprenyltransferase
MALNDYADRYLDVFERPERPLPSGRVRPGTALALARGLTVAGLGVAGVSGGVRALAVTVPLAGAVWGYDLRWKDGPAGPAAMAAARALDVLNGAGFGGLRAAAPAAAVVGVHTVAVTVLSRREVDGAPRSTAGRTALLAGTAAGGALVAACSGRPAQRVVAAAMSADYLRRFGGALAAVARDGRPETVRAAVGAGIMSLMPLQACLVAGRGRVPAALPIAAAGPLARRLARRISPT